VRQLVASELAEYPDARKLRDASVTIGDRQVVVRLREDVHFSLLGIFMGRGHFTVEARAVAEPQEIP